MRITNIQFNGRPRSTSVGQRVNSVYLHTACSVDAVDG
jgi:hypothetical protein